MARERVPRSAPAAPPRGSSPCALLLCCLAALATGGAAQAPALNPFSAYTASATASLAGCSADTFGGGAGQASFTSAVAATLSVDPAAVAVTGATDVTRRRLLDATAAVAFAVLVSSSADASTAASAITALVVQDPSAFLAALNSNLAAAGLGPCTGAAISAPVVAAPLVLDLSAVDLPVAGSSVLFTFANLSVVDAAALQTQLLDTLAVSAANATLTSQSASAAAALVLAVVSAAPGVELSVASQSAALSVLSAASLAPMNATSGVGQSIASALDAVATSAVSGGNYTALAAVVSILDTLAAGLATSLLDTLSSLAPGDPPPEPVTYSAPTIQMLVKVDPPGSSRLTTQPLSALGSASSFAPMPEGVLPTATPVVTTFLSVNSFDPHNSGMSVSGMTRLAFSNADGSSIAVANLTTPILFSLPLVQVSAGSKAACMFWDEAAVNYSTVGCATLPYPAPPGHTLQFVEGFTAENDMQLAMAWNITGPLLTEDCAFAVQAPSLLIVSGDACPLLQTNNSYGCSWNNDIQAFEGPDCETAGSSTECMCRHVRALPSLTPCARMHACATAGFSLFVAFRPVAG